MLAFVFTGVQLNRGLSTDTFETGRLRPAREPPWKLESLYLSADWTAREGYLTRQSSDSVGTHLSAIGSEIFGDCYGLRLGALVEP